MNITMLMGRITADPEIRMTTNGKKVCSFSLAVDDGKNQDGSRRTQFLDLEAWDRSAEFLERYIKKGMRIATTGRLVKQSYERDGSKHSYTKVVCDRIEFADGSQNAQNTQNDYPSIPAQNAPQAAQKSPSYRQQAMMGDYGAPASVEFNDDDLPF